MASKHRHSPTDEGSFQKSSKISKRSYSPTDEGSFQKSSTASKRRHSPTDEGSFQKAKKRFVPIHFDEEREDLDDRSIEKVHKIFEKKFKYKSEENTTWKLPQISVVEPWQVEELANVKTELNNLKDLLNNKELGSWHEHTNRTNIAGKVISELRNKYHVEMCTQAWSKCYEILSSYKPVDVNSPEINSIHLCEAPGAFIAALNHFLVNHDFSGHWEWLATTLNPYYEGNSLGQMIDDDRFIRSTMDNWSFGPDNTGDLMKLENFQSLLKEAKCIGNIDLVTADGSIDCQFNPSEQESVVSRLHWFEVLTCLWMLGPGGSFVIKLFTMYEAPSICMLYLLNCCFREVNVYKPATSKSGNSEVYVVCLDHKSLDCTFLDNLKNTLFSKEGDKMCLFRKEDIPEDFLEQHIKCCKLFCEYQSDTINTNIELFNTMTEDDRLRFEAMRSYCTDEYVRKYGIDYIPTRSKVVQNSCTSKRRFYFEKNKDNLDGHRRRVVQEWRYWKYTGSFEDRQQQKALPWNQQLQQMKKYDYGFESTINLTCSDSLSYDEITNWRRSTGQKLKQIQSSRFCEGKLIEHMKEMLSNCQIKDHKTASTNRNEKNLLTELTGCLRSARRSVDTLYFCDIDKKIEDHLKHKYDMFGKGNFVTLSSVSLLDKISQTEVACVVCDPLKQSKFVPDEEEVLTQQQLFELVLQLVTHLPEHSNVIIIIGSAFTRFTAGLLYILASSFKLTAVSPKPGGLSFRQILTLTDFTGKFPKLIEYLEKIKTKTDKMQSDMAVLEIVPTSVLIGDYNFTDWLMSVNRSLTVSFINAAIDCEKRYLPGPE